MKDIREMTLEETAAEIRTYEFKRDRGYAFVSYSHRNRDQVYPLVLSWLRAGYNIYIDLDFERHGSDSNWTDLMLSTLSSRLCRLGICFKSAHYRYSYASLLELLTMRGETVTNRHSGKNLYVDSIALEAIPDDDEIPEAVKELYAQSFQSMRSGMGGDFLGQNRKEADLLREGLDFWLGQAGTKAALRASMTGEKMMSYLQDAYQAGYQDFYPQIAYLVKNWFISQDLNGNDYSLSSSAAVRFSRFDEVRVERVRESLLPAPEPAPEAGGYRGEVPRPARSAEAPAGSEQAPFLCVDFGVTTKVISLRQEEFTLGRSVVCGYRIADNPAVGRVHAMIRTSGGRSVLVDQNSKNGTYLNGARLSPGQEYELREGDKIGISSTTFTFHL